MKLSMLCCQSQRLFRVIVWKSFLALSMLRLPDNQHRFQEVTSRAKKCFSFPPDRLAPLCCDWLGLPFCQKPFLTSSLSFHNASMLKRYSQKWLPPLNGPLLLLFIHHCMLQTNIPIENCSAETKIRWISMFKKRRLTWSCWRFKKLHQHSELQTSNSDIF